jgi:hypothetical protein
VPEGGGRVLVELDGQVVLESRELKPERLPARAGADLHHTKPRQADLLDARSPLRPTSASCRKIAPAVMVGQMRRYSPRLTHHQEIGGNYGGANT